MGGREGEDYNQATVLNRAVDLDHDDLWIRANTTNDASRTASFTNPHLQGLCRPIVWFSDTYQRCRVLISSSHD